MISIDEETNGKEAAGVAAAPSSAHPAPQQPEGLVLDTAAAGRSVDNEGDTHVKAEVKQPLQSTSSDINPSPDTAAEHPVAAAASQQHTSMSTAAEAPATVTGTNQQHDGKDVEQPEAAAAKADTAAETPRSGKPASPLHVSVDSAVTLDKQKWVQCAVCNKWRKVPFTVTDEQLGDDWQCRENVWDSAAAACEVPQVLSNEEIDSILALQDHQAAVGQHKTDGTRETEEGAGDDEQEAAHRAAGEDAEAEEGPAAVRGGRGSARSRGHSRRITGPGISPTQGYTHISSPAAVEVDAAAEEAYDGDMTPTGRSRGRIIRGAGRWGSRRGGGGGRGSRGGSSTPRAGQEDEGGMYQAGFERPAVATVEPDAATGAPVRDMQQAADVEAGAAASDLGEAAEALLGMGMGLQPEYHQTAAAASAAALHEGIALAHLQYQQQQQQHVPGQHKYGLLQHQDEHSWRQQQYQHQPPIVTYPLSALRPGKVVWAKVEGHDWWPACVVRRRAVPKEVGPPPGGQVAVMESIPVVFFTAKGIPREVEERLDTPAGLMAASMRAIGLGDDKDDEEAEYAWLPYSSIKPFNLGDVSGNDTGIAPADPVLMASVAAAENMLRSKQMQQASADLDDGSDSDGGWGISREQQPPPPLPPARSVRGRGRNNRARGKRGGRGRGGRGGRGRRGFTPEDDENSDSEGWAGEGLVGTAAAAAGVGGAPGAPKNTIESILAWRMPLTEEEREQEQLLKQQQEQARARKWEAIQHALQSGVPLTKAVAEVQAAGQAAGQAEEAAATGQQPSDVTAPLSVAKETALAGASAVPDAARGSSPAAAAAPGEAAEAASAAAVKGELPGAKDTDVQMTDAAEAAAQLPSSAATADLAQEEADAAAALLGFGSDDTPAAVLDPAAAAAAPVGVHPLMAAAAAAGTAEPHAQAATPFQQQEPQYLVKWSDKAHIHNEWLLESQLLLVARRKLLNFKKCHSDAPVNFMEDEWTCPERFVARRPSPNNPGWEVLVKWKGQGYDACTWESEQCAALMHPEHIQLHLELWERQKRAINKAGQMAQRRERAAQQAAERSLSKIESQPSWVLGSTLHPHQLEALQWLRSMWAQKRTAVLADEQGAGKTASCIAYLSSLLHEFHVTAPILVVVPSSLLSFWEGELAFWSPQDVHVMSYSGSAAARTILYENELWLQPASLDGKVGSSSSLGRGALANRVPKADIVLTTYEVVCSDIHLLSSCKWSSIVIDRRQRTRSAAGKAQVALQELASGHQVVLSAHGLRTGLDQLFTLLTFVKPGKYEGVADVVPATATEPEQQAAYLASLIEPHMLRRCLPDIRPSGAGLPSVEVQLQVDYSPVQAEAYKTVLARNYEVLADPKPPRLGGSRAAHLKPICNDLRNICQHAFMLPDFEPERIVQEPAAAAVPEQPTSEAAAVLGGTVATDAEYLAALIAGSGKLQLLDIMLQEFRSQGKQVLVLAHSPKALELLSDFAKIKFGADSFEVADITTPAAEQYAAMQRFNAAAQASSSPSAAPKQPFIFLMSPRSIGLGTVLPSVSAAVIFESDWHPRLDLQALHRAHVMGAAGQLAIYRIVLRHSVDERLLQLADRRKPLNAVLRPGAARSSSSGARTLEDVIKWGSSDLFANMPDPPEGAAAAAQAQPATNAAGTEDAQQQQAQRKPDEAAASGGDVEMGDAAALPSTAAAAPAKPQSISYSSEQIQQVLQRGAAACSAAAAIATEPAGEDEPAAAGGAGDLGGDLWMASVRNWPDLDKRVGEESVEADDEDDGEAAADADERVDLETQASLGPQIPADSSNPASATLNRSDSSAASSAYWSSLLKTRWENLKRDEADEAIALRTAAYEGGHGGEGLTHRRSRSDGAGLRESILAHERDGGFADGDEGLGWGDTVEGDSDEEYADAAADAAGSHHPPAAVGPNGELLHHYSSRFSANMVPGAAGTYADQAGVLDYEQGARARAHRGGRGSSRGGRNGAIGGRGPTGRGQRRRRTDDDSFYTPPGMTVAAELMRMGSTGGAAAAAGAGLNTTAAAAADADRPNKRRRKAGPGLLHEGGGVPSGQHQQGHLINMFDPDNAAAGDDEASRALRLQAQVVREFARMEQVKAACQDISSVEHAIAMRAFQRIEAIVQDLGADPEIIPMACQAAEIMMIMRQDDEVPSDFQDYSLVTLVGVAAHLMHQPLGEGAGLELLAAKYGHDVKALDQVFWHILTKLAYYRELTLRIDQLMAKGLLDPATLAAAAAAVLPDNDDEPRHLQLAHDNKTAAAAAAGHPTDPLGQQRQQQQPQLHELNEVDSFGAKLSHILSSDLTAAALSQGSLDTIPLGPLATLMPLLQMAGQLNDPAIKSALKQVRESQESMVLLDRTHTLKVQQIQKEYQDFMERIRNKAQGAIDSANRDYQSRKTMLSARINVMVEYLNTALQAVAQQIQRATAAADGAAAAAVAAVAAAGGGATVEMLQAAAAAAAAAQHQHRGMDLSAPLVAAAAAAVGGSSAEVMKQEPAVLGNPGMTLTPQQEQQVTAELLQALASGRLQVDALPDHLKAPLITLLHNKAAEHQAAAAAAAAASQPAPVAAVTGPQVALGLNNRGTGSVAPAAAVVTPVTTAGPATAQFPGVTTGPAVVPPVTAALQGPAVAPIAAVAQSVGIVVEPAAAPVAVAAAAASQRPLLVTPVAALQPAAVGQPAGVVVTSGAAVSAAMPAIQQHLPVVTSVAAGAPPAAAAKGQPVPGPLQALPVAVQQQQQAAAAGRAPTEEVITGAAAAAAGPRPGAPNWQVAQQLQQLVNPLQVQLQQQHQQQQQQHVQVVLPGHVAAALPPALAAAAANGAALQQQQQQLTPGVPTSVAMAAAARKQVLTGVAVPPRPVPTGVTTALQVPVPSAASVTTGGPGAAAAQEAAAAVAAGNAPAVPGSFTAALQEAVDVSLSPEQQQQQHVVSSSMPPPSAHPPVTTASGDSKQQQQQHVQGPAMAALIASAGGPSRVGSLNAWLAQSAQADAAATAAAALAGSPRAGNAAAAAAAAVAAAAAAGQKLQRSSESLAPLPAPAATAAAAAANGPSASAAAAAAAPAAESSMRGASPHPQHQ